MLPLPPPLPLPLPLFLCSNHFDVVVACEDEDGGACVRLLAGVVCARVRVWGRACVCAVPAGLPTLDTKCSLARPAEGWAPAVLCLRMCLAKIRPCLLLPDPCLPPPPSPLQRIWMCP